MRALVSEVRYDQEVSFVYKQGSEIFVVQLFPFAVLLQLFQFPEWEQLMCDMFHGFRMLGPLTAGAAWHLRSDAKYARPIGPEEFRACNSAHVQTILRPARLEEHTEKLRAEVAAEAKLGRFRGPWPRDCLEKQALPAHSFVAKAFPIVQTDKVRRADDWLRSGHNSTVWAADAPAYMGASTIIAAARYCAA